MAISTTQDNYYNNANRAGYCRGLPNQPTCMNRATLETGFCYSCNDKPKIGETWFVKLPSSNLVHELTIKKLFKRVVDFDSGLLYKIDDIDFIEKVIYENKN